MDPPPNVLDSKNVLWCIGCVKTLLNPSSTISHMLEKVTRQTIRDFNVDVPGTMPDKLLCVVLEEGILSVFWLGNLQHEAVSRQFLWITFKGDPYMLQHCALSKRNTPAKDDQG